MASVPVLGGPLEAARFAMRQLHHLRRSWKRRKARACRQCAVGENAAESRTLVPAVGDRKTPITVNCDTCWRENGGKLEARDGLSAQAQPHGGLRNFTTLPS